MRILLIDDSLDTGLLVKRSLSPYEVVQSVTLADAADVLAQESFQLLLIDVSLPDGDGFSFCENLSREGRLDGVPKIFLSAHDATSDKVFGLNCGADDYVTKPFDPTELKARVDSRLRSQTRNAQNVMNVLDLEFDSDFQKCSYVAGAEKINLNLTPTEFRILLALAKNEGKPLSRQEIVRAVWTANGLNIEKRGINSHIVHLRKKLEVCPLSISSVYAKGYALVNHAAKAFAA